MLATKFNDTLILLDENYDSDYNDCFKKSFVNESNFKNLEVIKANDSQVQDYIFKKCLQFFV